jgi:hypothetical protein
MNPDSHRACFRKLEEISMDANQMVWNEKAAKDIIGHLEKRRMEGSYAATADQAREEILAMIPKGATVFRCGSMTAAGMGLWEAIARIARGDTHRSLPGGN